MRGRLPCVTGGLVFGLVFSAGQPLLADPVLSISNDSLTTSYLSASTLQKVNPLVLQRGSDLEGGVRLGGAPGPAAVAFTSGYSASMLGGIDLATLTWAQADVDLALPTDGPSVVIGRTFNHRQGTGSAVTVSDGPQGKNWFQSAMPEIVLSTGPSGGTDADDIVYVVLGAGRFLEYKRRAASATVFVGVNGASGAITYHSSGGYETYTLTDAMGTKWTFWGDNTATSNADWQFWKKEDAAGRTAYAGDKSTPATAISNGYSSDGIVLIYQEYGTGSDLRRYTFTYTASAVGTKKRLQEVKAELNTGGNWSNPTEVGRVTYGYYPSLKHTTGDADDTHGDEADLKSVKIRTPLTDSGASLGSGVYDERTKYYRYYETYKNQDGSRGHTHTIKLILGFEGSRRYDWGDSTWDDDFADETNAANATDNLKPYADAWFEYESATGTQRILKVFYNGECGCGGGGSAGVYEFTPATNGSFTPGAGYTVGWVSRTAVKQPDGAWTTHYIDEVGQPLSSVVSNGDPSITTGKSYWVTGVERNASGQVVSVHSPANCSGYTHDSGGNPSGAISYSSGAGLVTAFDRYTSTEPSYDSELDGMLAGTKFRTGTSGTDTYTSKSVLGKRALTVGAATVVRPLVTESRGYFAATSTYTVLNPANYYNATTYTYDWWDTSTNTNQLYITLKSVETTLPSVDAANNGQGVTHDAFTYLRKDGRAAMSVAPDGIITATTYNNLGLPKRTVRDANPDKPSGSYTYPGDFDTGYGPSDFGMSTSNNSGLRYATEATYDNVGRTVTTTVHADTVPRKSYTYYSLLGDHRLATISSPLYVSGTPSWSGPFSYSVSNQGGRGEFSATIGTSSAVTTSLANWITETDADPIDALDSTLEGTSRANVMNVATTIYDTAGVKVAESRRYTVLATSGSWTGTAGTDYDATAYTYDGMGRAIKVVDPTGTIDRTVFDSIGRMASRWTGTSDTSWPPVAGTSASGNMVQVEAVEYDSNGVGNGHVTKRTAFVAGDTWGFGSSTDKRETLYVYDVRGNLKVLDNPAQPDMVMNYDVLRRQTVTAGYSTVSGLTATADATTATNRLTLSKAFYDERGRVFKTSRHKIDQSDGSDDDSLDSTTWYDSVGRVIKTGGTSLTKTFYDRLGRPTHRFALARTNDSSYTDADDVSGDIVLEESQTIYDDADKTGLVLMTGTILRNYDYTTAGALDLNGDASRTTFTTGASDIVGRLQATAMWYDSLDRPIDTVVYGSNGGSALNRSGLSAPSRGGTPLRTTTVYDAWGRVDTVEQPRIRTGTTGYITKYLYDHASRKIAEIRNHTGASTPVTPSRRDSDLYTRYEYTKGLLKTMWVDVDGDGNKDTGSLSPDYDYDQVTEYAYDPSYVTGTLGLTPLTGTVAAKRLLLAAVYPEQVASQSIANRSELFAYNAQGQKVTQKDQNGTIHAYTYDTGGRLTDDGATTTGTSIDLASGGSNIDTAVLRIHTDYEGRGMVSKVAQYTSATVGSGSIVDEVAYTYDDWGVLTNFQQDYNSAVGAGTADDVGVQYTLAKADENSPTASNYCRSTVRITDAKLRRVSTDKQHVKYAYSTATGSGFDDDASRVSYISDSTGAIWYVVYVYGGQGMVVRSYLGEPQITDVIADTGTSGWATGLDQFNRRTRSLWKNGSSGAVYYDARPAYDDNSNITKVEDAWVTPWSALYTSDGLNRLDSGTTGTLVTGSISNASTWRKERWTDSSGNVRLSQTGNWTAYTHFIGDPTAMGAAAFDQTRTHSGRNELNAVTESGSSGAPSIAQRYARNGLVTRDDTTLGSTYGYRYTYDAWNRLVKASTQGPNATVAEYRYNGLGHRIGWKAQFDTGQTYANNKWRYFQYNEKWQQVAMYRESGTAGVIETNPLEMFLYNAAGNDGRGGSSYIDSVLFRDRDSDKNGSIDEHLYYLQNWRYDVVQLMTAAGSPVERYRYDAYGRPGSFSPADIRGMSNGPDGLVDGTDSGAFSATGSPDWDTDLGQTGSRIPDNVVNSTSDTAAFNGYYALGTSGGIYLMSDDGFDNRKGLAGYEFDPILNGDGSSTGSSVPLYHVRHRVLSSDAGKWLQPDPLGYHDSMDLYEYCVSDPLGKSDAYGLCTSLNPLSLAAAGFTAKEIAALLGLALAAVHVALSPYGTYAAPSYPPSAGYGPPLSNETKRMLAILSCAAAGTGIIVYEATRSCYCMCTRHNGSTNTPVGRMTRAECNRKWNGPGAPYAYCYCRGD